MNETLAMPNERTGNPFPGLRPFETAESYLFFGREGQSEELLKRLRQSRLFALVGTSGSGKSSLVGAGLVPYLYGGLLPDAGSQWRVVVFRPGENPIRNLAEALNAPDVIGRANPSEEQAVRDLTLLEVRLRRSGLGLIEVVRLARLPEGQNLLVIIDQFEELFRFAGAAGQPGDDAAFVKLILEGTRQTEEPIYVVLTMRSDFIGDCAQFRDLPEAVATGLYLIPRMTRDQQRAAIEEPARVAGGTISGRLVNRLLNDAGDDPDQLPILQHALMRAWDHWRANRPNSRPIDLEDYDDIGGMAEALSQHADEAYNDLDEKGRDIARRMFQCLTEKGADNREVRRAMRIGAIAEVVGAPVSEVIPVIEEFRRPGRSFLMPLAGVPLDADKLIDISHESLIRHWKRLSAWVDEEGEQAKSYRRLAETAVLHEQGNADLWGDIDLASYRSWSEPTQAWADRYHPDLDAAKSFLAASRMQREASRRRKRRSLQTLVGVIVAVILILSGLTTWALVEKNEAQNVRASALKAAEALGKSTAGSGRQIEEQMQAADAMLSGADNVVLERASLRLSFASVSETLGDYSQQSDWVLAAKEVLDPVCGENAGNEPVCRKLLARAFEEYGDYLFDIDKPADAVDYYEKAARVRAQLETTGEIEPELLLARARTEASRSRAFASDKKYDEALAAAASCREAVSKAGADGEAVRAGNAGCDLAQAEAERLRGQFDRAIATARVAHAAFGELAGQAPDNIGYAAKNARAAYELALALWQAHNETEAIAALDMAKKSLAPVYRSHPQNDQLAEIFSDLLNGAAEIYHQHHHDDSSAAALEQRMEVAKAGAALHGQDRDNSRTLYWRGIQISTLRVLADRYSGLERHVDALGVTEELISLESPIPGLDGGDPVYPADVLWDYYGAGFEALKIGEGRRAFDYLHKAITQSERGLNRLRTSGQQAEEEYLGLYNVIYETVFAEAFITAEMLPFDTAEMLPFDRRQMEILKSIANDTSRYAIVDPRVIRFKQANAQSLYNLAHARQLAGDMPGAREGHEAASEKGWAASTLELVKIFENRVKELEASAAKQSGPPTRKSEVARSYREDSDKAEELDQIKKKINKLQALAAEQASPPTRELEVIYKNGEKGRESLYFLAAREQMEDEYYRLDRYRGAKVTDDVKRDIEIFYAIRADIATGRAKYENGDLDDALNIALNASDRLADLDKSHDPFYLGMWDQVARIALDFQEAANEANNQVLVQQAKRLAQIAIHCVLAIEDEGSGLRKFELPENLEDLGWQEVQAEHYNYAVDLYHRAIEMRDQVRANDRENTEPYGLVASDYHRIGIIEEYQNRFDDALIAFEREVMIYEDLYRLSTNAPSTRWDTDLAAAYGNLAELFGDKRNEPRSALFYAKQAAEIRRIYASRQEADSQARLKYAASLEAVSDYAWALAKASKPEDPKAADAFFDLAVKSRTEANAVRSGTRPSPSDLRKALGGNLDVISSIYISWERPNDARALVDNNVEAAKQRIAEVSGNAPEYRDLQYDLALALEWRSDVLEKFKDKDYSTSIGDLTEAATLLRPLIDAFPDAAEDLRLVLLSISFDSLFVGKYQQALDAADEGLGIADGNLELMTNKAHALMFLGRTDEARQLYLGNIGKELDDKTWEYFIRDDFEQLKAAGRTDPLMDEVLKAFDTRGATAARS
jgi:hypothetical protein